MLDLIPKQDVKGGRRQLLFGASEDNTHNKPNKGKVKCNGGGRCQDSRLRDEPQSITQCRDSHFTIRRAT